MRVRRVAWLATVLAGCVDQTTAPGVCPTFCPSGQIDVVDTVLAASIARDSTFRGYVLPHQAGAMTASDVPGVVDSRAILRTSALVSGLALNTGDTTTSPLVGADSMKLTLTITRHDTTAHNLTVRLYRLPITIDSTTTFADLRGAFADPTDSLRAVNVDALLAKPGGVDSATGDQAAIDTTSKFLKVTVKLDSLQAPYVSGDSGKLGIGVRIGADAPTSVGFCTRENACGASLAWFVKVDSIKGTDTTLIHKQLAAVTLFDSYVFDPPIPPVDSTLAVGGAPSARSIMRITLPRAIRDSSQIIRGTLLLVPAVPARGAPVDSFVVEAHTVASDFGAKSPLVLDATRTDTTMIRVGKTDTVRVEVTNLLQFWVADSTRPEVLMLRSQEEAARPTEIRFYPSAAAPYRPALRITYARRFPFGVP